MQPQSASASHSPEDFPPTALTVAGEPLRVVDLAGAFGPELARLPLVLRVLLENLLRCTQGDERRAGLAAMQAWLASGRSEAEVAFQPGRVLMHDTTSTPALVDIAAMRDVLAQAGADPLALNPRLPVEVSVDHSLAVQVHGRADAPAINLAHEMRRNQERYRFLRWASGTLRGVHINPPGTGIMHTLNMEQLATVVTREERGGQRWLVPDTLIGTDSHTPMVNGLGVLGWGVGGLEAQTVMFGMPTMLRLPDVVGVRLSGRLNPGVQATDLALVVTKELRALGVAGDFVEFFGPGVAALDANQRCVLANMAPEYGATTGYFPIDERTLDYLRATGRDEAQLQRVEAFARHAGLWLDPLAAARYTRTLALDLGRVGMHIAGPQRPQDLLHFGQARASLAALGFQPPAPGSTTALPRHPVAVAAITSCTNTSDPRLLIAAGLVARKARRLGLRVPPWVKTSLAPGSPAAADYLQRAGLLDDLAALGFDIVGYGCTTCIGNAGPLTDAIRLAQAAGTVQPVAALSGNRNFPGRVHPDVSLAFLMSPALVLLFALAGDAEVDLSAEPVQHTPDGQPVHWQALWPSDAEIDTLAWQAANPADYRRAFRLASHNAQWEALQAPDTPCFPWNPASTTLKPPPFVSAEAGSQLGHYSAYPLLVLGDDVTTDHISPASAIPPDSGVADFLVAQGEPRDDLNVFAARRGNWEVMLRATFHSKTLRNLLAPHLPVAHTLHAPSGEVLPIWQVAQRHALAGEAVVLVAGERYGTGSSRDWAAKGPRLLGVRAVLAVSFERIHRSNLVGMGILPLLLPQGITPQTLALRPGDRITVDAPDAGLQPRCAVPVQVLRTNGERQTFSARAAVETQLEVTLLRAGGVIPLILQQALRADAPGC